MSTGPGERRLLGWGIRTQRVFESDHGVDIVLTEDAPLDVQRVSGMANLEQCLRTAFTTALGSDVFNVDFGFDGVAALAKEPDPVLARERVRVSAIQVLARDGRIRRVLDLQLDAGSDGREAVGADERRRRWGRLDVEVVFEAVTGDQRVIDLLGEASGG